MNDFELQLSLFGYAIIGHALEQDAVLAETANSYQGAWWDLTRVDLSTSFRDTGKGWERVPDYYGLLHLPAELKG